MNEPLKIELNEPGLLVTAPMRQCSKCGYSHECWMTVKTPGGYAFPHFCMLCLANKLLLDDSVGKNYTP